MARASVAFEELEIVAHRIGDSIRSACRAFWSSRCPLRLGECQDPLAVRVFVVVGQAKRAICSAQVLHDVATSAAVATHQPRAGTAGELAIAQMQPGLDQSEKWLVAHRKPAPGGSILEVGIADFAWHGDTLRWVQYGSNIRGETAMDNGGQLIAQYQALSLLPWTAKCIVVALSRRKQGFESPRERGVSKKPSTILNN